MDKLLNFVAGLEKGLEDYRVSVTPTSHDENFDFMLSARQIIDMDENFTHSYELDCVDDFRSEFSEISVTTGVMNDIADVRHGVAASERAETSLGQHWIEVKVRE